MAGLDGFALKLQQVPTNAGRLFESALSQFIRRPPSDSIDELTQNNGRAYRDRTYEYYRAPRYW
jgi:hypothetical protein